jgi:23S rRNA (pseudouridine1915-N3)-methyltransferase
MQIEITVVGATKDKSLDDACERYVKMSGRFMPVSFNTIGVKYKGKDKQSILDAESKAVLNKTTGDFLVLLDEKGNTFNSVELSKQIDKWAIQSKSKVVLLIGGAYGFADSVYKRADYMLSLSKMTFNHQVVRLMLVEQVYRALTIRANHPYHNS